MDEIDAGQQDQIHRLQARDVQHDAKLADMERIVAQMRARAWADVCITLVLVVLNVFLLFWSVDVAVTVVGK